MDISSSKRARTNEDTVAWFGAPQAFVGVAIASVWLDGPIILGLDGKEIVLLALTALIGTLTFSSGRATVLQGAQHLAVFASFVFLSLVP